MKQNKIKFIDLFAGAGGLTDGFLQSGYYKDIAAVEWLKRPVQTLRYRLKTKWNYSDADNFVMHYDIQREHNLFHGWNDKKYGKSKGLDYFINKAYGIDVVIGGPPCQAYSIAGRVRDSNGMRNDYRNFLFEHYLNIVKRYHPKLFVFENVPGILSAKPDGKTLIQDDIDRGFKSIGYEIINNLKLAEVNAYNYAVPQCRKRIIIVGIRKNIVCNSVSIQSLLQKFYFKLLPKYKYKGNNPKYKTVKGAIGNLQKFKPLFDAKSHKHRKAYIPIPNSGKHVNWQKPRYQNIRDMGTFHILEQDLATHKDKFTNSKALTKLYAKRVGSVSSIHRYHVLQPDKPSTTILAHLYKDGNRFIHYDPNQCRTITPREAARLQSFDDDFKFIGGQGAVYQMIGNAVPPNLAKAIGCAIHDLYNLLK